MNFIDRIFVGELTSTIMCEECENISTVKEPFIDLSLPIIEERTSKPVCFGRTSKGKQIQEADTDQFSCSSISALTNQQSKLSRKCSLTKDKVRIYQYGHLYMNSDVLHINFIVLFKNLDYIFLTCNFRSQVFECTLITAFRNRSTALINWKILI
ncbi:PREDICTED: ubiquitin carboxyl-terminal hydrolase 45-like [Thamnophis sirtalis]|uniref:Ubiquitin carboxyl-terminal hydrolase 45-like n=1 Tax=Thamnophis sirtalis TaxID=35019 RepID=A0A6I9WYR6_9SAUR|nr:PREDICTED: ubiquitin carboxyl-terminal hydrolase 45-like [Thamnophis sirtalis]